MSREHCTIGQHTRYTFATSHRQELSHTSNRLRGESPSPGAWFSLFAASSGTPSFFGALCANGYTRAGLFAPPLFRSSQFFIPSAFRLCFSDLSVGRASSLPLSPSVAPATANSHRPSAGANNVPRQMGDVARVRWLARRRRGEGMLRCLQGCAPRCQRPILAVTPLENRAFRPFASTCQLLSREKTSILLILLK